MIGLLTLEIILIPIISQEFLESIFCTDEWASFYMRFVTMKKNSIMPIIIDDVEVPTVLAARKYYNYYKDGDYENYLLQLRQVLSKIES